jgi:calmodulin
MQNSELRETFDRFDRDHNGAIDFGEFRELLKVLDAEMEEESHRVGFDIIDSDRSGTIQFEEFAAWWNDE